MVDTPELEPKMTRRSLLRSTAMLASSAAVAVACGPNVDLGKLFAPRDKADFESTNTLDTYPSQVSLGGWRVRYLVGDPSGSPKDNSDFSTRFNTVVDVIQFQGKDTGISAQLYETSKGEFVPMLNVSTKARIESLVLPSRIHYETGKVEAVVFENPEMGETRYLVIEAVSEPQYGTKTPRRSIKITEVPPVLPH